MTTMTTAPTACHCPSRARRMPVALALWGGFIFHLSHWLAPPFPFRTHSQRHGALSAEPPVRATRRHSYVQRFVFSIFFSSNLDPLQIRCHDGHVAAATTATLPQPRHPLLHWLSHLPYPQPSRLRRPTTSHAIVSLLFFIPFFFFFFSS
jgi:hypothetical protein